MSVESKDPQPQLEEQSDRAGHDFSRTAGLSLRLVSCENFAGVSHTLKRPEDRIALYNGLPSPIFLNLKLIGTTSILPSFRKSPPIFFSYRKVIKA
jgi:hypothetical protein